MEKNENKKVRGTEFSNTIFLNDFLNWLGIAPRALRKFDEVSREIVITEKLGGFIFK